MATIAVDTHQPETNFEVSMQGEELQLHQEAGSYVGEVVKAEKVPDSAEDMTSLIQELREAIELPLTQPELFTRHSIAPWKELLLYGLPGGRGKTLLEWLAFAYPFNQPSVKLLDEICFYSEPIVTKQRAPRRTKYRINSKSRSLHR